MEIWKQIEGYEGLYEISDLGRIHSVKRKIIKKFGHDKYGYSRLGLCKYGKWKYFYIHTMVAKYFLSSKPTPKHQINHLNGIKADNRAVNLEWCTSSENHLHAFRIGLRKPSSHLPSSTILSFEKAEQIRKLRKSGMRVVDLCALFGVKPTTVYTVIENKKWTVNKANNPAKA